jgi:hypothetical protein
MLSTYLSVVNTGDCSYSAMYDATRPYAVVEVKRDGGGIIRVLSRHETKRGACISCGKRAKR